MIVFKRDTTEPPAPMTWDYCEHARAAKRADGTAFPTVARRRGRHRQAAPELRLHIPSM